MSPVDPGRMRNRLWIQEPQRTPDGAGGFAETFVDGHAVWAEVKRLSGDIRVRAMQTHPEATHEIRTWAGAPLRAERRFRDDEDRVFRLLAPPEDEGERHEFIVVLAQEEVP